MTDYNAPQGEAAACARTNKAEARVKELEAKIEAFKAKLVRVVNAGDRLCLYAEYFGAFSEPARSASVVAWDAARKEACGE